ncbi:MAG TPA: TetR/AcrR family transcriptional regulator [Actinomycetota bacterium]|nr:TetR/AcrR family transcriptional regulator [Actinomycetota bacterium]
MSEEVVAAAHVEPRQALMDAAERLLVELGYAGITTRNLAKEAGVNHGLVHYYFGSMENLFAETLERFTERLIERQRAMYQADIPFIEKWRTAIRYLEEDLASGYQKVWLELQALAWNRPDLRGRVARVNTEWRAVLTEAFSEAMLEYRVDGGEFGVDAIVSLVMTFNEGIILERHCGIFDGQRELLGVIDAWLESLAEKGRA